MPEFTGNSGDVVARGIRILQQTTPIRQFVVGGKARAFLETLGKEIENVGVVQDKNLKKAFLATTYGQFLDQFGAAVGLTRYPQRNAEVLSTDSVIRFTTRLGGTFGSINDNQAFIIPAGTLVTSPAQVSVEASRIYSSIDSADTVYDRSIHYSITEDVVCGRDETTAYASARAMTPGIAGNLAAPGMLKKHSFVGYADHLGSSLIVTNTKPILNGYDAEGEASFRYRISKALTSAEKANEVAIRNAALSVPGVVDVVIIPFEEGSGRFNVYIKSISSIISDQTVADVQTAIDSVKAVGTIGYARKPYEIGVEISSNLLYKTTTVDEAKPQVRQNLTVAAIRYLNSLDLGQMLDLSAMADHLVQLDGRVSQVGKDRTTMFDSAFIWHPAKLVEGGRRREKLALSRLNVPLHARIIAETSIDDPIRFI